MRIHREENVQLLYETHKVEGVSDVLLLDLKEKLVSLESRIPLDPAGGMWPVHVDR